MYKWWRLTRTEGRQRSRFVNCRIVCSLWRVSLGFTDGALSLSEGSESSEDEFSEAESDSEDERVLRAENKARREEAAKAKMELELAAKAAKRKGRKRKSVTVTSQVSMAPLVTEPGTGSQPQT